MLAGDELLVSDQKKFTAYIHISENLKDYMELTGFITRPDPGDIFYSKSKINL
jgi:hypothetical protein